MGFHHVYGPVPSRRLGRSIGVNPIPLKTCNYSCVYCQLGRTRRVTDAARDFYDRDVILREIGQAASEVGPDGADCVTFVGEGEPTLCASIGDLIQGAKELTDLPVAVVTNGSRLSEPGTRSALAAADTVMPSLDAGDESTFRQVNRPHPTYRIRDVADGLAAFREQFGGRLWVEVMLVGGVNDGEDALHAIREALDRVRPDRVYVNVPIRPPAEVWVRPPGADGLVRAQSILGAAIFIDYAESGGFSTLGFDDPVAAVEAITRRHPMRDDQISDTLSGFSSGQVGAALAHLEREGRLQRVVYRGATYYAAGTGRYPESGGRPTSPDARGAHNPGVRD